MAVLVLSDADIHAALDPAACEAAMTAALAAHARGDAFVPLRSVMAPPKAGGFMGLMPAWAAGTSGNSGSGSGSGESGAPGAAGESGAFAVKTVCLMPANRERGVDIHQGAVLLFDGEDGMPRALLNAAAITEIRTAAVTAAATRALAPDGAEVLGVLGSGVQARAHLRALAGVRPWREVRVFSPRPQRAQALAADGRELIGGADVRAVDTAREAVEGADVLVTATSSSEPVFEHEWLSPRAHVNAVGASSPNARELPVATVAAAALFCDSRESVLGEALEFRLAVEEGAIAGPEHIRAELGELFAGTAPGRTEQDGITLFRSLGIGVEDLAAAQAAVRIARERGLGTEVTL